MNLHSKPGRHGDLVFALAAAAGIAVLVWVVLTIQGLSQDLRTANTARDALARQVQQLGAKPVAGMPGSRGDIGPAGPRGESGPRGPSGPRGVRGPDGSAGKDGTHGGVGPTGQPGEPGASGQDGRAGAAGEPGPAGPQGDPGTQGEQGPRGEQGPAGPGPSSWSFTYRGTTYQCTPDSDDGERYTCQPVHDPEPEPSHGPGLLGVGLIATATYRKL